ncbi:MAG: M20/M25/M40 family metallo-hydrolase [Nitrososphaerota archaeon]|nr:M20/M25/M40 family metallo-hydrolase [Nitrososphaerota archaeon]
MQGRSNEEIEEAIRKATSSINEKKLVQLLVDLINIPSRTGEEASIARFFTDFMKKEGLACSYQSITETRANSIGRINGKGGGPTLIFNGHFDTSWVGNDEDLPVQGEYDTALFATTPNAKIENDMVYGLGAFNMKGGLAASVAAASAIIESGAAEHLKGDIVVTGVAGEIEKTPVKSLHRDYSGIHFHGGAFGTEYLMRHGLTGDFAIVGEPSGCHVSWINAGYSWFKIQTKGKVVNAAVVKDRGVSAIQEMIPIIQAIEKWGKAYTERERTEFLTPYVNVDAIESGWPYKLCFSPGACAIYVDVRMIPGRKSEDIRRELERVVASVNTTFPAKVEMYMSNFGEATDPKSWIIRSCIKAHERVKGRPHTTPYLPSSNVWADANVFRRHGIPSAMLGPGDIWVPADKASLYKIECVPISSLVECTKMYVVAALDSCLRSREEVVAG